MKIVELQTPRQGLDIEELAVAHHDEYGGSREFDRSAISKHCFQCVLDPHRKYVNAWIMYDDDDKPVGYIVGTMRDSFYSKRYYAIQEMWYVLPRARGTPAGIELLVKFEQWAIQRNAERIYMQVEHDANESLVERIFKLMCALGYKKQGYVVVKVPTHTHTNTEELNNDRTTHRKVGAGQEAASI